MTSLVDAPIYLNDFGIANSLGRDWKEVAEGLFSANPAGLEQRFNLQDGRDVPIGQLSFEPAALPAHLSLWESRNNRLTYHCLMQMQDALDKALSRYGRHRIGVVVGTSTSGIERSEWALDYQHKNGKWPESYHFERQELGDPSAFVAAALELQGPYFSVSTACTSGAKSLMSAARLVRAGICDAVIAGGVDTLCGLTLNGFSVLDSVASERCNPFSRNRSGISLGEGGALFLLTRESDAIRLAGYGESSDAHHLSAPDPDGRGARRAIEASLEQAQIEVADIAYINLHGTATRLNDAMEAAVTHDMFGMEVPCSSTKALTGHMLGAAGSNEAAFIAMALQRREAPPHLWDGVWDEALPRLNLASQCGVKIFGRYVLSNSYAFGGNNAALILAGE